MSGYKVFQSSAVNYKLEPARYETIAMVKLTARYELRINCNFIGILQTSIDAAGLDAGMADNLLNVEVIRKALCENAYNTTTAGAAAVGEASTDAVAKISVQWAELINLILRQTAWAGASGRTVSQAKVDTDMAYTENVGKADPQDAQVDAVAIDGDNTKKNPGIKQLESQTEYDTEKLGDMINNSNMREILVQMRNHGCFVQDEDKTNDAGDAAAGVVVNPKVQLAPLQRLLDANDELVFPIDVTTITGYDESVDFSTDAYKFEINIVFKQNVQGSLDVTPGHATNVTTELDDGNGIADDEVASQPVTESGAGEVVA